MILLLFYGIIVANQILCMRHIKITPSVLFGLSQAIGAPIAIYYQSVEMQGFKGTEGVTVSVFFCLFFFDLFNAVLSVRIWRPDWKNWRDWLVIPSDTAQKEARTGFLFYMISSIAYLVLITTCLYSRIYIEHVNPFQPQDFQTAEIVIITAAALYATVRMIINDPLRNPYFCGVLGFVVVLVPQVASGVHILRVGTKGVSEHSLWIGLCLIVFKIIYYSYVHIYAKNNDEKSKAKGVLIAETGNFSSWLYVLRSFYTTLH